jgi:hypothetical protein
MTTFAERMRDQAEEVADSKKQERLTKLLKDWLLLIDSKAQEGKFTVDTWYCGRDEQYPAWEEGLIPLLESYGLQVVYEPGDYQEMMSYDRTYISWK